MLVMCCWQARHSEQGVSVERIHLSLSDEKDIAI